jgi:riboflavin kinase/FMN adenylyltransferase
MIVLRGHPFEWEVPGPSAVTVGVFDGVHLGHRRVIEDLVTAARRRRLLAAAVTFDPHPLAILAPAQAPAMLTSLEQRLDQFRLLGIELAGVLSFPDIRELTAADFAELVVAGSLQARLLYVGSDFRFGKDRQGDVELLIELGPRLGLEVVAVDMLGELEGVVSSTRIRRLLGDGEVARAAVLLARPYELSGRVVAGDGRGRLIGFPTANLAVPAGRMIPGDGVYACRARVGGDLVGAMVNIGHRPTFAGSDRRIEAHLFGIDRDLYGEHLVLQFIARLRDEQKFPSVEELVDQLQRDAQAAQAALQ